MQGRGWRHQQIRARYVRFFRGGGVVRCARGPDCYFADEVDGQLVGGIVHGEMEWDLDHKDDRTGYLGPAHAKCNRSAGARKRNRRTRRSRAW